MSLKSQLRERLDSELFPLQVSDFKKQQLFDTALEAKRGKKRFSFKLIPAVLLLIALAGAALAATGAFDALLAMWEESFARMHTTGAVSFMDETDIPVFLSEFEESYGGQKDDLIISTVPGEADLSLEDALRIARKSVMEKFGTPSEELDSMGVYPQFFREPYHPEAAEWDIYYTPRTGENIDDDHDYPAPGEYRVYIGSPSGEVTYCGFYCDAFWPEYALRCWNCGSRAYVYEEAGRSAFLTQSLEDQEMFLGMFEQAGYDTAVLRRNDESRLQSLDTAICFAEPQDNLLNSGNTFVQTAVREMEKRFGLTLGDMENCFFIAIRSPLPSDTVDICFSYNFNLASKDEEGICEGLGRSCVCRLGRFMICLDAETGEAVKAVWAPWDPCAAGTDAETLLGRDVWTKDDLPEYARMLEELRHLDAGYIPGRDSLNMLMNEAHRVMLSHGGDEAVYPVNLEDDRNVFTLDRFLYDHGMTAEQINETGVSYLLTHADVTREQLESASFLPGTQYDDMENPSTEAVHPSLLVILEEGRTQREWYLQFDMDLNVTDFGEQESASGANG